jgi:hypothetical protein
LPAAGLVAVSSDWSAGGDMGIALAVLWLACSGAAMARCWSAPDELLAAETPGGLGPYQASFPRKMRGPACLR